MDGILNLLGEEDKLVGANMPSELIATHGVMEGGGSYNLHARVPAEGASLALPFLEEAVRNTTLDGGDQPVVIADYGSSQGKNSFTPMRAAIKALRARVGPDRPICVAHIDQTANDFNTLFDVLHSDPERYSAGDPNVFPSAIGRSFYESVLPKGNVHLGWSSYAAVWLSRIPMLISGHFVSLASTGEVRAAFERQGAEDWKFFLSLRANELRPGGRLVVVLPGRNDEGAAGFEPLFGDANEALAEMVVDGAISAEDRARMVLGAYPRRRCELLAPFGTNGRFDGLTVEHCDLSGLPDAAWADYERNGDTDMLSTRHARFFRSIFVPSLASAIADEGKRNAFPDRLEEKLKRRLADRPAPFHSFVQTIVLAKQGSTPTQPQETARPMRQEESVTTPAVHQQPTPERFFNALNSYELTEAMKTAVELEVFTAIAEGNTTSATIAKRCGVAERGARILCDFLTIHNFLTKEGVHYGLAPDSALFLDRHSPAYLGTAIDFLLTPQLRECHAQMTEAVRRGGTALNEGMLEPENPDWVKFAQGMMPMMHRPSEIMATELRRGGEVHKVLDIAASHGIFGISVAKQNPAAHIYACDWNNVLEVAQKNAQAMGIADRYHLLSGSAFEIDFGSGFDLALITNFLHVLDRPTCTTFMRKVHAALTHGGRAAIAEFVPNPDRVSPPTAAAFSIMMLAATPSGDAYTFAELEGISKDAGFARVELAPTEIGINRLVIAYR